MITGGLITVAGAVTTNTVNFFNPVTLAVSSLNAMKQARAMHEQIAIPNNDVGGTSNLLVVGGRKDFSGKTLQFSEEATYETPIATCEIYDGTDFAYVGSMTYGRYGHKLVLLADGRVMAIGGIGYNPTNQVATASTSLTQCEIYDPKFKAWFPAGSMATPRAYPIVGYSEELNCIYVAGGATARSAIEITIADYVEKYDIATGKWSFSSAREPYGGRVFSSGVSMGDGVVLLVGGLPRNGGVGGIAGYSLSGEESQALFVAGSDVNMAGGLTGFKRVSAVLSTTEFEYTTPDFASWTQLATQNSDIITSKAVLGSRQGPYLWDPQDGISITAEKTFLIQNISAGVQYGSLDVADTSQISVNDDETVVSLAFGYEEQAGPLRILGILSDTSLKVDYNFVFPQDIDIVQLTSNVGDIVRAGSIVSVETTEAHGMEVGQQFYLTPGQANFVLGVKTVASIVDSTNFTYTEIGVAISSAAAQTIIPNTVSINKLLDRSPYVPDEFANALHLTPSNLGRVIAEQFVDDNSPAGVNLNKTIVFPSDRGLGNEGYPTDSNYKLSENIEVFGSDAIDAEYKKLREE